MQPKQSDPGHDKAEPCTIHLALNSLIQDFETNPFQTMTLVTIATQYQIPRRRLYDITNILEIAGWCRKDGGRVLICSGRANFNHQLTQFGQEHPLSDLTRPIADVFREHQPRGLKELTADFLRLYRALQTPSLNLKVVADLFTSSNSQYRSTLCKLYQVAAPLNAVGITSRTNIACQVVLNDSYIDFPVFSSDKKIQCNPVDVQTLLNDQASRETNAASRRREELRQKWKMSPNNRTYDGSATAENIFEIAPISKV